MFFPLIIYNMAEFDQILFGKKSLSSLFKDIYDNSRKTELQVSDLITTLKPFITTPGEAVMIVPMIKEYLEVKVKNDEHLIKLAAVVQRCMVTTAAAGRDVGGDLMISEEEKKALLETVQEMGDKSQMLLDTSKKLELPESTK